MVCVIMLLRSKITKKFSILQIFRRKKSVLSDVCGQRLQEKAALRYVTINVLSPDGGKIVEIKIHIYY